MTSGIRKIVTKIDLTSTGKTHYFGRYVSLIKECTDIEFAQIICRLQGIEELAEYALIF